MLSGTGRSWQLRQTSVAPLVLYLLTALGGVWLSWDRQAAWGRFEVIAAGVALYVAVACLSESARLNDSRASVVQRLLFGTLPAVVAAYFLLTNDWSYRIGKIPPLDPAMRWFSEWLPNLAEYRLDSNVVGGVIAAFIPLQICALRGPAAKSSAPAWASLLLLGLPLLGLVLSASRGAWLAFALTVAAWGLFAVPKPDWLRWRASDPRRVRVAQIALLALVIGAAGAVLGAAPGHRLLGLRPDRLEVWRNSLDLAGDYTFTGLGLQGFEMAYSSYALLVHVPYIYHAHNLLLDLHLQQGLLGLAAYLWLVLSAAWPRGREDPWRPAGRAALAIMLIHGCLDDPFYGYGGAATPLLLLPVGVLSSPVEVQGEPSADRQRQRSRRGLAAAALAGLLGVGLAVAAPALRSQLLANLGASLQTRAELAVYRWPEWPCQDAVRRSQRIDLAPAIAMYEAALASDPGNVTANRRLGQVELSRGHYESAYVHLLAAYRAAPNQRATRQILGELHALTGDVEAAGKLWREIDLSQGQLELREWWYGVYLHQDDLATRIAQARARLSD